MIAHLEPCPVCRRHVRVSEAHCPFCDAAVPISLRAAPRPALVSSRIGSSQKFAYRALAAGAVVTACGGQVTDQTPQPTTSSTSPMPMQTSTSSNSQTGGAKMIDDPPPYPPGAGGAPNPGPTFTNPIPPPPPPAVLDAGGPIPIYRASPR